MPYCVYILFSASRDRYYVGATEDIASRLLQHNAGRNKSTKAGLPWEVQYTESFSTRVEAVRREAEIKSKKSRKYIRHLISPAG